MNPFTDPRLRRMWDLSDSLALRELKARSPDAIPPVEWEEMLRHEAFSAGTASIGEQARLYETDAEMRAEYDGILRLVRWVIVENILLGFPPSAPWRILDLGTHTGATATAMSNRFPMATVFAREVDARLRPAIERTVAWRADTPANVVVEIGDHLAPALPEGLNIIYAGEVFEHVLDWPRFVAAIEAAAAESNIVIMTTPLGPWESDGGEVHHHVAHWDAADLYEVFGQKRGFNIFLAATGASRGWAITRWVAGSGPTGAIDYGRKLKGYGFEC